MIAASTYLPRDISRTTAASSIQGTGAQNFVSALRHGRIAALGIVFGPNSSSLRRASSPVRPVGASIPLAGGGCVMGSHRGYPRCPRPDRESIKAQHISDLLLEALRISEFEHSAHRARYHQLLVRVNHADRGTAGGRRYHRGIRSVAPPAQPDAEEAEPVADPLANRRGVLPDAPGEHQRVQGPQGRPVGTDPLPRLIAEEPDGLPGPSVAGLKREQVPHVRAPSGYPEKAGLVVHHAFKLRRCHALPPG